MERYLEGIMGRGGGSDETGRDVAIGVGVDAVKNVIEDEVSSRVDNNGKELVEEAVGKEKDDRITFGSMSMNMLDCWVEHVLLGFMNMSLMNPSLVAGRRGRKGKVGKVINWLLIHRWVFFFSCPFFFLAGPILPILAVRWPAMMPGQVAPPTSVLVVALREVAGLLQQLGNAPAQCR